jgi:serine/threonine protein kinase
VDYTSSNEDYTDDGDEDAESYRPGGYHPVHIGDLYNKRYLVVQKLGWGHFSTVWMCQDITTAPTSSSGSSTSNTTSPTYVAMKIQKSASHYREAAFDEIELLRCIRTASTSETFSKEISSRTSSPSRRSNSGVVSLLDHFEHNGPHGKHVCMVFEMLGENLLKVIKNYDYRGISIPVVQNLTRQVCRGLDFLHRHCGIIHTDLKPENILIGIAPPPPSSLFVKSLIEQQSTQTKIQQKKKKTKTAKKGSNKQSNNSTLPQEAKGTSTSSHSADMNGLTTEQKKKMKKKMKKQRQKARKGEKSEKGTGRKKNGTKAHGDVSGLPPVDELREMTLMEQASEPLAPVTTSLKRPPHGDSTESDEDDVDDGNVDDENEEEEDEHGNSPKNTQSPIKAPVKSVLLPRTTLPWLRHTLFAAINMRSVSGTQYPDLLPSPIKFEDHSSTPSGTALRNELQPSPIHFPRLALQLSGDHDICKMTPISSHSWSYIPKVKRSKIYMVRCSELCLSLTHIRRLFLPIKFGAC